MGSGSQMRPAAQSNQSQLQTEVSHIHKPSMALHVDQHHRDFVFIMLLSPIYTLLPACGKHRRLIELIETITYWQLNKWLLKKNRKFRSGAEGCCRLKNEHRMKGMWLFADSNWMKLALLGGFVVAAVYLLLLAVSSYVDTVPLTYIYHVSFIWAVSSCTIEQLTERNRM